MKYLQGCYDCVLISSVFKNSNITKASEMKQMESQPVSWDFLLTLKVNSFGRVEPRLEKGQVVTFWQNGMCSHYVNAEQRVAKK